MMAGNRMIRFSCWGLLALVIAVLYFLLYLGGAAL